jgi:hypothetical protein
MYTSLMYKSYDRSYVLRLEQSRIVKFLLDCGSSSPDHESSHNLARPAPLLVQPRDELTKPPSMTDDSALLQFCNSPLTEEEYIIKIWRISAMYITKERHLLGM